MYQAKTEVTADVSATERARVDGRFQKYEREFRPRVTELEALLAQVDSKAPLTDEQIKNLRKTTSELREQLILARVLFNQAGQIFANSPKGSSQENLSSDFLVMLDQRDPEAQIGGGRLMDLVEKISKKALENKLIRDPDSLESITTVSAAFSDDRERLRMEKLSLTMKCGLKKKIVPKYDIPMPP